MKTVFVGSNQDTAEKVSVAVRLRWPDADAIVVGDPDVGLEVIDHEEPEVVIFQSTTKGTDTTFIEGLRAFSDVPLVVIEPPGGGGVMNEVKVLEAGADAYISESDGSITLIARLVALTRRASRSHSESASVLSNGPLTVDPAAYEVFLHGARVPVTPTEFRLLYLLLNNRGNVLSREFLARSLWGGEVDSSALVKKYIQRLRQRLNDPASSPRWIANIHGVGYKLLPFLETEPAQQSEPAEPVAMDLVA